MRHLDRSTGFRRAAKELARLCALAPAGIARQLRLGQTTCLRRHPTGPSSYTARSRFSAMATRRQITARCGGPAGAFGARPAGAYFAGAKTRHRHNQADIHTYLPDDFAGEGRRRQHFCAGGALALLDHVLLEWAARLPSAVKMAGGKTKALFKSAMAPFLPREILERPKMGFGCPIDQWLRAELKELAYDTLLSPAARRRGLFRPDFVRRLLDEHCAYRANHHTRLWALLMLELWFRTWIDGEAAGAVIRPAA